MPRSGRSALGAGECRAHHAGEMGTREPRRVPAGRQRYDALNGLRIGAMAGALLGAIAALVVGSAMVWLILVMGAVGGFLGYRFERHHIERERLAGQRVEQDHRG